MSTTGVVPAAAGHDADVEVPVARHRADHRRRIDSVVALVVVVALGLPSLAALAPSVDSGSLRTVAGAACLVMAAALAWRRTRPVRSVVAVYLGALVHFTAGAFLLPVDLLVLVALYSVTAYGPRWARRAALAGALLGAALQGPAWVGMDTVARAPLAAAPMVLGISGVVLAVWASGLVRRARVDRLETLEERARRLELERDQQAQIAVAAERARIAREMHDVVAHSLSVVIAQADGGRYAARSDPAAAERALATIGDTGRSALADTRRILGILRDPEAGGADRLPQPVDADLDTLVEQVRASGLPVSLVRTGAVATLPPGAGLSVYRIAQEALTNVLKHAGPAARATVALHWRPSSLVIQVEDDGRGAAAEDDGAGHGLVGMRERVALFGGELQVGPRAGGGFTVRAEIPLSADDAGPAAAQVPAAQVPTATSLAPLNPYAPPRGDR